MFDTVIKFVRSNQIMSSSDFHLALDSRKRLHITTFFVFPQKAIIFSVNVTLVEIRYYVAYLLTWVGCKNNRPNYYAPWFSLKYEPTDKPASL